MPPPARTGSAPQRIDKKKQFFFLQGDDEAAIERFKTRIIETHLTPEQREENYREIIPTGQTGLRRVLGDVVSELATVSFLPDARRIVTLYPVPDLFEARSGKSRAKAKQTAKAQPERSASEHLVEFIEKELSSLPAVLIVIAVEDYEKWRRVAASNPLLVHAQNIGTLFVFKQTGPQFAFFDALFARNTGEAISLWRQWIEKTGFSPKAYFQLAAQLRLLIQAKTATSGQLQSRGISRQQFENDFMPPEPDKNLFKLHSFRQDRLKKAAGNFTFPELLNAYEKLENLQKYAIPLQNDIYVPDKGLLAELWITEFTAKAR